MIHKIKSETKKGKEYDVTLRDSKWSCSCPDHQFRNIDCKHIRGIIQMNTETQVAVVEENKQISTGTSDSMRDEFREAKMMIQSGLLPSRFKTEQQVMTAYRFAKETGLQPLTAMRQMAVINGTPSFYGDLPKAMVENSGKLESIDEYLITKDYEKICIEKKNLHEDPWAAVCIVKRKGDPVPCERFFSIRDAEKAGLFRNPVWKSYLSRMLTYRARSMALKDKFSDCLNGVAIAEYDFNATVEDDKVIDVKSSADLNERFK